MDFEPEKWIEYGLVVCQKETGGLFIFEADQMAAIESDDPAAPLTSVLIKGALSPVPVRGYLSDVLLLVARAQEALRHQDAERSESRALSYAKHTRAALSDVPLPGMPGEKYKQ